MRPLRLDVIRTESELTGTYEGNPFRVEVVKDDGYRFLIIPQSTGVMRITTPGCGVEAILERRDAITETLGPHTHAEIKPLLIQILSWSKGWETGYGQNRKGDEERLRHCFLENVTRLNIREDNRIVATTGHVVKCGRHSWSFRMIPKNTIQKSISDFELDVSYTALVDTPMIRTLGVMGTVTIEDTLKPGVTLTHLERAYVQWLLVSDQPWEAEQRWNDLLHAVRTEEIRMEQRKLLQIAMSIANPIRTKREQLKLLLGSLRQSWILRCVRDHGRVDPLYDDTIDGYDVVVGGCRLSLTKPKLNKKFLSSYNTAELKQEDVVPEDAPLLLKLYAKYLKEKTEQSWIDVIQELVQVDRKHK